MDQKWMLMLKALPVTYGNKSAVQLIVRDITEKKKHSRR